MKSWTIHHYGSPDVVQRDDVPDPEPGPNDVLIRVEAASVNPLDDKHVSGALKDFFPVEFPYALGTDAAGTVVRVGAEVKLFRAGDRVFVNTPGGAFSDLLKVPAASVARIPGGVSFAVAATLPTAAGTAWEAVMEKAQLKSGQTLLVHAASGGVGHFAVQFGKLAGAHVVATCSDENRHLVSDLGADEIIDYKTTDFRTEVSDVDVVLDSLGGETLARSMEVVRRGGVVVSLVAQPDARQAAERQVQGLMMRYQPLPGRLEHLAGLVADGKLRVVVAESVPFARLPDALAKVATGHVVGKVVVSGR